MPKGIILVTDAQKSFENHRILLNKKDPFQRMDENPFIKNTGKQCWDVPSNLIQQLIELKDKKKNSDRFGHMLLSGFTVAVLILFAVSFTQVL